MSREKELTKNTLIITIGRISTQFIAFLLLPLYTSLLSTKEYGTVDFILTLVNLLIPVMSLMIDQGVFRYLLNAKTEEEQTTIISSAFGVLTIGSFISAGIFVVLSVFINSDFKSWLLLILIAMAYSNLFLQTARGLKHTADYALGSFVCSSSTIILNVLCIAFLKMGAQGMLIATFTGNLMCTAFLFLKLKIGKYLKVSALDRDIMRQEMKYSIPLVPNQLSLWVMNSSDRIIVTMFLGAAANGILAISHKFPVIYMTFFNIFLIAWQETGAVHYFDEDRDEFFSGLFKKMLTLFSTLCIGVMIALPVVFDWLVKASFVEAYYNIPIYLIASLCNVVIGLLGVVYVATKKTAEIAKTTFFAAIINVIVNLCLIKFIGLYAASLSTLVGYFVTMVYRIIDTKKYLNIRYDRRQVQRILILLTFSTGLYYINNKVISVVCLLIFVIGAYLFNKDICDEIINTVSEKVKIPKEKLFRLLTCAVAVLFLVSAAYIASKLAARPAKISKACSSQPITAQRMVFFGDFGSSDFTCTGLAYDNDDDSFWIGDYGALSPETIPNPRLVEVDKSLMNKVGEISLKDILGENADLQGVAYDGSLWIASNDKVFQIDKKGNKTFEFSLGKYSKYKANGICCDKNSLWVLCASRYLLNYTKKGELINKYKFNFQNQDHICANGDYLYITVGADYKGMENYICKLSKKGEIVSLYQTEHANALEGISVNNGKIYVANDGKYHSDIMNRSYITVYEDEK